MRVEDHWRDDQKSRNDSSTSSRSRDSAMQFLLFDLLAAEYCSTCWLLNIVAAAK
jgi:hypothetical protein